MALLSSLGGSLLTHFLQKGNAVDLEHAIEIFRECLALHDTSDPGDGDLSNTVAAEVRSQLQKEEATVIDDTQHHGEPLELRLGLSADRGRILNNLATAVRIRFDRGGDPKDIDEAVGLHRDALELHIPPHPDHSISLNNLASAVRARFQKKGDTSDMHEAIDLYREALQLVPTPHPDHIWSLKNLASALGVRFLQQGDPRDIDGAIELHREALRLCPVPHKDHFTSLDNLAGLVHTRFERGRNPKDMDEVVELHRQMLELHPAPHPYHISSLNNLANAVRARFLEQRDPKDIDEAINLHREALELVPAPHPHNSCLLNNLGMSFRLRFGQQGDSKDIDEAIELHREASDLHTTPNPQRGSFLSNLSMAVLVRFHQRGDPKDIDEAIELAREALELHIFPRPDRGILIKNLANAVLAQFEQQGHPKDIDEAIKLYREVVELCAAPHPEYSASLDRLGGALLIRFLHQGDSKDIDETIKLYRQVMELQVAPRPSRGGPLNNLAVSLKTRFEQRGDPKDIDEGIRLLREALRLYPAPLQDRSTYLDNLASIVRTRFLQQKDPHDIDEAIELHRQALELRVPPHPEHGVSLHNLALAVRNRFEQHGDLQDIDETIELHRKALQLHAAPHSRHASTYLASSPLSCFHSANQWAEFATKHDHTSCLDAYRTSISLLPRLAAFHLDIMSRQQMLTMSDITSLASTSATYAISLGQTEVAVEFLEASRSVFWTQALHLRTPLDKLTRIRPDLATKLGQLSRQLEHSSFRDTSRNLLADPQHKAISMEVEAAQCRQLNENWEEIIKSVRMLSGFEDFMLPKSIASLRQAAISGPIIILVAGESRSSALIVTLSQKIQCVPLPHINRGPDQSELEGRLFGAREGDKNLTPDDTFRAFLAELWRELVKPVFDILKLKKSAEPPRLWWCPTGPFAFLPIHAAGIYTDNNAECVADYIVPSYTPTLTALLAIPTQTAPLFKFTTVIESNAPNCSPLPGTKAELQRILDRVPTQWLTILSNTTGATVIHHLHDSSIVHFACHGVQDSRNPLDSGLMLSDGRFKVSLIMQNSSGQMINSMSLAFLSACETAKGDQRTPDESMHLAATLLFAGFRGVVATMWTMDDKDGPNIADTFYEHLFEGCDAKSSPPVLPNLTNTARALHLAVMKLRKDPGMTFQRWVPFVHYGL
ncbi:tetratricopeptide repeat-containing protein [Mycena maculata]|uniref:Tetratricopeptide repeat-containing protein n=1 Tax=Mycena maculata TaxID=230809 RepID=A0AAD7MFK0_9AGAR|nr:tetratricopeptide repeat-containing protein [Mycena maculata]